MRPPSDPRYPASSFRWTGPATPRPQFELVIATLPLRAELESFAQRCSDESLFRRFHGGGRGTALQREIQRWVTPSASYLTIAAMLGGRVHGVGNLAISRDGVAEMAVLVEDEWRRRGVASRLLRRLTRLAIDGGHEVAHVDIQPDNHAALTMLGAMARDYSRSFEGGSFTADIALPARSPSEPRTPPKDTVARTMA